MVESLYPPHSRLFIACDRETTEDELLNEFRKYGSVVNVKLSRERNTGKPKGIAFIQYDKTSEAAAAIEGMSGRCVGRSVRPIKVTVALTKDQSGNPASSDPSQFLRLFLVVPKSYDEDDLRKHFSQYGAIDTVSIVKDRETKESKGYGYVKFKRFVHAAKAFEECDRMFKAVFAKPREQTQQQTRSWDQHGGGGGGSGGGGGEWRTWNQQTISTDPLLDCIIACTHIEDNPEGYSSVWALVPSSLSDEQVEWLFDIPPGLEYVRFFQDPHTMGYRPPPVSRKVMAQYDSPGTAAYAFKKLNNFEYPAGEIVQIKPNYDSVGRGSGPTKTPRMGQTVASLMQQVESLTKSLSEATKVIKSSGMASSSNKIIRGGQIDAFRCSVKLPPPQPLAPKNSVAQERLFWVCEPGLPPQDALWDVFGRFGNLIELYVLNGKNCGYAKYADKGSALKAVETLNGEELYRMRMKVLVAEPQEPRSKRLRTDE